MTIEQYGRGRYLVRVFHDDFRGAYRFETREEAEAFALSQRGYDPPRKVRLTVSGKEEHDRLVDVRNG
jgi:hypothetical protein